MNRFINNASKNNIEKDAEYIYNITPCYYFSFSNDGYITRINATLLDHLGYTAAEVVNILKLESLLTVGSRIFFQTHFYPLIKMQGKANEIFLSFKSKIGVELPVLLNVFLDSDGNTFEIHCGGMQISQRNRFEKEILEAKKVAEKVLIENEELANIREQLLANQQNLEMQLQKVSSINMQHRQIDKVLAHDLQEPLRKILIFASMLADKNLNVLDNGQSAVYIAKITTSATKIRSLIQSMQRYISLDHTIMTFSEVNFNEAMAAAIKKVAITDADHVGFSDIPTVSFPGKFALIVSMLHELIENSMKFRSLDSPILTIKINATIISQNIFRETEGKYKYGPFVKITYSDNGIGFDDAFAAQAFELFRKLYPDKEGVGIGLAYCKKIVDLHHGFILVKSAYGIGTTFEILLPLDQTA